MGEGGQSHIPVLLREVLEAFAIKGGEKVLDCTFGGGGHSGAFLRAGEDVFVVGLDCDPEALGRAEALEGGFPGRFKFYGINFGELDRIEEEGFDCILFDLGVSSFQLDQAERGFSFRFEGDLDMRLNPREGLSAAAFLETAEEEELVWAVRDLGEEREWKGVVRAILDARGTGALHTTEGFASLVKEAIKRPGWKTKIHPATKVFQGVRMAINGEVEQLERALPKAFKKLAIGGILGVITFHSGEDRIVKRFFKRMAGKPEHRLDSRTQDERTVYGKLRTGKPIVPMEEEIRGNPRARSSKLRILEKTAEYDYEK